MLPQRNWCWCSKIKQESGNFSYIICGRRGSWDNNCEKFFCWEHFGAVVVDSKIGLVDTRRCCGNKEPRGWFCHYTTDRGRKQAEKNTKKIIADGLCGPAISIVIIAWDQLILSTSYIFLKNTLKNIWCALERVCMSVFLDFYPRLWRCFSSKKISEARGDRMVHHHLLPSPWDVSILPGWNFRFFHNFVKTRS